MKKILIRAIIGSTVFMSANMTARASWDDANSNANWDGRA